MTTSAYATGSEVTATFQLNYGKVSANNTKLGGNSISYNAVTYLPVRNISEAMGLKVDFNNSTNTINLTSGGEVVKNTTTTHVSNKNTNGILKINSVKLYVNNEFVDSENIIYQGTTYLPLRKIAEVLGVQVEYDSNSKMVNIITNKKPLLSSQEITIPVEPTTIEDFEKVLLYMGYNNLQKIDLKYNPSYNQSFVNSNKITNNVEVALKNLYYKYTDLFSGVGSVRSYSKNTEENFVITVELEGEVIDGKTFVEQQQSFVAQAKALNESLKAKGVINNTMSQREIAKVLFTEVTTMLQYDTVTYTTSNINLASFTGYGAIKNKLAVCQGYTALYNYLLKLNGIECFGQAGTLKNVNALHIWTVAVLDGEKSYIDATYGDKDGYINYDYFDIDKNVLSQDRSGVE